MRSKQKKLNAKVEDINKKHNEILDKLNKFIEQHDKYVTKIKKDAESKFGKITGMFRAIQQSLNPNQATQAPTSQPLHNSPSQQQIQYPPLATYPTNPMQYQYPHMPQMPVTPIQAAAQQQQFPPNAMQFYGQHPTNLNFSSTVPAPGPDIIPERQSQNSAHDQENITSPTQKSRRSPSSSQYENQPLKKPNNGHDPGEGGTANQQ